MPLDIYFKEELLHFIWQHGLFDSRKLITVDESTITLVERGEPNTNSGPDFKNAIIELDGLRWAGNIEIHLKTSDWEKHGHHLDAAYNNTILHVVYSHDKHIYSSNRELIPVLELKNLIPDQYIERYKFIHENIDKIPCKQNLPEVRGITREQWLSRILVDRLKHKTKIIQQLLFKYKNNWEEVFYILLASNFGFKINTDAMRQLASSVSLMQLSKQKNNLFQIESLLFGQAGFLDEQPKDEYQKQLTNEYKHLKKKLGLTSLDSHIWKLMRTRPVNFPTVRIAQFASLIHQSSHLFSKIIAIRNYKEAIQYFDCAPSTYWTSHYNFGEPTTAKQKKLGITSIHNILTNTVIPCLFLYGKSRQQNEISDRALDFLYQIPAEKNHITANWNDVGWNVKSMADSQALIHLFEHYCNHKRCLECAIGHEILQGGKKGIQFPRI